MKTSVLNKERLIDWTEILNIAKGCAIFIYVSFYAFKESMKKRTEKILGFRKIVKGEKK